MFSWLLSAPLKKKTVQFPGCDRITCMSARMLPANMNVRLMSLQWRDNNG